MGHGLAAVVILGWAMAGTADARDRAVALAKEALSDARGLSRDTLEVEKVEAVKWPDTSLGCPEEGMMYAQVLTPGHRVVLRSGGESYDVHVGGDRAVVCCPGGDEAARPCDPEPPGARRPEKD